MATKKEVKRRELKENEIEVVIEHNKGAKAYYRLSLGKKKFIELINTDLKEMVEKLEKEIEEAPAGLEPELNLAEAMLTKATFKGIIGKDLIEYLGALKDISVRKA